MALYFSFSLNFPTAAQWHNRVFVHCLEEPFVNCFASRTASFVCVLPQIQKVPQQRIKLKEKKCNFYSLRISLQMEKFSNCVFQNVLNWEELKENSFCSYTGTERKRHLKIECSEKEKNELSSGSGKMTVFDRRQKWKRNRELPA